MKIYKGYLIIKKENYYKIFMIDIEKLETRLLGWSPKTLKRCKEVINSHIVKLELEGKK